MGSLVSSKNGVSLARHVVKGVSMGVTIIEAIALRVRVAGLFGWRSSISSSLAPSPIECTGDKGSVYGTGGHWLVVRN